MQLETCKVIIFTEKKDEEDEHLSAFTGSSDGDGSDEDGDQEEEEEEEEAGSSEEEETESDNEYVPPPPAPKKKAAAKAAAKGGKKEVTPPQSASKKRKVVEKFVVSPSPSKKTKRSGKTQEVPEVEEEQEEPVKYTSEISVAKGSVRDMSAPTRHFDLAPFHLGDNRYFMQVGNVQLSGGEGQKFNVDSLIQTRKPAAGGKGKPFHFHTPLRLIDTMFNALGEIIGHNMTTFKAEPNMVRKTKGVA